MLIRLIKWFLIKCVGAVTKKIGFLQRYVILQDGGIVSQMEDYVFYRILVEKGLPVRADFSWYTKNCIMPWRLDRILNLKKIKKVSKITAFTYRNCFPYKLNGLFTDAIKELPPQPAWLGGYPRFSNEEWKTLVPKYIDIKSEHEVLDDRGLNTLQRIRERKCVGVHVRRGDMSTEIDGCYWKVHPAQYFINVTMIETFKDYKWFFFSEDKEWVEEQIIPNIDVENEVVEGNDIEHGYRDLYLMMNCDAIVTSQGSLGKCAFHLNRYDRYGNEKRVIAYDEKAADLWKWERL